MKIRLNLIGISYRKTTYDSYIAILSSNIGLNIPVVIKLNEVIAITKENNNIKNNSIYNVLCDLLDLSDIILSEIFIYSILEGIFYTKLIFTDSKNEKIEIDCSIGDALVMSVLNNCPIYTTRELIDSVGIKIDNDVDYDDNNELNDDEYDTTDYKNTEEIIKNIKEKIENAIKNEEYEKAAELRDKLKGLTKWYDKYWYVYNWLV